MENEDLARWINDALRDAKKATATWRKEAREWYDFYAGNQWSQDDIAEMQDKRKVPVVFNRVARTVNAVIGLEIQNRQAVQYIPREVGDTKVNEIFTSAADWIRDNCDAEDEESEMFGDNVICGIGATETRIDYDTNPDGEPVIERVDPLEVFWDAAARKKNLRDRRWCARVKRSTDQDIRELWPQYELPERGGETYLDDEEEPHDADPPHYQKDEPSATQPKTRELVCFQWWEKQPFYRFAGGDGQVYSLDAQQYEEAQARWAAMAKMVPGFVPPQVVPQTKRVYFKAYLVEGTILEVTPLETQSGFTLNFTTGARDRNHNTWFGLVALMMDPQRWANKWLSQIMHILNTSAKGGLLAEKDAFSKTSDAESSWAKSETITWANPGAISGGKVTPKPQTPMPEGFAKLLDFAVNSINDVPGVNMELMGLVGNNQPGVLESMRKQAGMTILAVFFDSMRLYRKELARVLIEIIRDKISDGRLVRIAGKDGAKYVPLIKQEGAAEYDIVVDEAPTSPNNKERVFALMTTLAPVLEKSGIPLTPDLLEYSPLPSALVEKWQAYIKENKQLPPEVMAQVQELAKRLQLTQAQAQAMAQENARLKADQSARIHDTNVQAQVDQMNAMLKRDSDHEKAAVAVYEANLQAAMAKMTAASEAMAQQQQSIAGLVPVLQQLMAQSMSQAEQIRMLSERMGTVH